MLEEIRLLGALLYFLGLILIAVVHWKLGNNFSKTLEIRQAHDFITGGIYRYIRHAMYAAFFILCYGAFLLSANWLVGDQPVLSWSL